MRNILEDSPGNVLFVVEKFIQTDDFYTYPVESRKIGIFKVSKLSGQLEVFHSSDVVNKCFLMPHRHYHVAVSFHV